MKVSLARVTLAGVAVAALALLVLLVASLFSYRASGRAGQQHHAGARATTRRSRVRVAKTDAASGRAADRATESPPVAFPSTIPLEDLAQAEIDALCSRLGRCGRGSKDLAACRLGFEGVVERSTLVEREAVRRGEVSYDPKAAATTLRRWTAGACEGIARGTTLVPLRGLGETCVADLSCRTGQCEGGIAWEVNKFNKTAPRLQVGRCTVVEAVSRLPLGAACDRESGCADGYCDEGTKRCTPHRASRQPCETGSECADDLLCVHGICLAAKRVGEGEACSLDDGILCDHLRCGNAGRCMKKSDVGDPCSTGTLEAGSLQRDDDCVFGLTCVTTSLTGTDGRCGNRLPEGARCSDDYECLHYRCGSPTYPNVCLDWYWSPWVPGLWRDAVEGLDEALGGALPI